MPNGDTHTRIFAIHPRAKVPKAHEMLANARAFFDDAQSLGARGSNGQFFLYAHAIELGLKSFLHLHGVPLDELRKRYSHDLFEAVKAARRSGLVLPSEPTDDVVQRLDKGLERAALRYEVNFELPSLQLVDFVADQVIHAAASGQMQPSPS